MRFRTLSESDTLDTCLYNRHDAMYGRVPHSYLFLKISIHIFLQFQTLLSVILECIENMKTDGVFHCDISRVLQR